MSYNDSAYHSPELRQAVMTVCPEYYGWPEAAQECYRANISSEDDKRIRQMLLKSLLNVEAKDREELDLILDDLSIPQLTLLNKTTLPIRGIGQNCFWLNEGFQDGRSLLDFETLYDYDYDDFVFQEASRREHLPSHVSPPYTGSLYFTWARLQVDDAFYYATLSSLAPYVMSQTEDHAYDKIEALIPYRYVPGKDHGAVDKGRGSIFNMQRDANGMEGQLDELQYRYWQYSFDRANELGSLYQQRAFGQVLINETMQDGNPQLDFVFSDTQVLKRVRFKSFMCDCRAIEGDYALVEGLIVEEQNRLTGFLEENYQDIVENYDPKVLKLRKKRKIVITDQAVKDIANIVDRSDQTP